MAFSDKDETPMLSDTGTPPDLYSLSSCPNAFASTTRSNSLSIPVHSPYNEPNLVGLTGPLRTQSKIPLVQMSGPLVTSRNQPPRIGPRKAQKFPSFSAIERRDSSEDIYEAKNEHLLRSGQLGMCNDPYCTTCPTYYHLKAPQQRSSRVSEFFDQKFHNALYDDAKGWARRFLSSLLQSVPVMNPHARIVQRWTKFFAFSCLVAIFVDPLFFFLLSVEKEKKCIVIDWPMTKTFVALRSVTDFIYFLNILLQFRLAYVAPESTVVGAGELVDHPKKIALNYLWGFFPVDFFVVLPLPQILVLSVLPKSLGSSGANYAKNLLRAAIVVQYIPRLFRFLPLLAGQSPSGLIFESAWGNFVINLLTFMLASHFVGSCWYLFGLQRVNQCLRDACHMSGLGSECRDFIDCGHGHAPLAANPWINNENASNCLREDGVFSYGIYKKAVDLTTKDSIYTKYIYSLFWGFQQISTLAGNQEPSYFEWEVLFTMGIIGLGLLLFALLIGNMQNFLQSLGRRRLEMSLRRRDVEQWMRHRRLPEDIRRRVQEAERYNWAATRGVNEELLFKNLPEDLQTDIRRHLFKFVKKVRIFSLMDEPVLDAIRERLRQTTYIRGSRVLFRGALVDKMVFIVRGKMESIGEDGTILPLAEGDACGEELLASCLERSSVNANWKKMSIPGKRLLSTRDVTCLTNVEAFSLRAADLEEVTSLFSRFLRNPRVQGAIRYESPYWRLLAATRIQVAWRYRKKRQKRIQTSQTSMSKPKTLVIFSHPSC